MVSKAGGVEEKLEARMVTADRVGKGKHEKNLKLLDPLTFFEGTENSVPLFY